MMTQGAEESLKLYKQTNMRINKLIQQVDSSDMHHWSICFQECLEQGTHIATIINPLHIEIV